MKLCIIPARGGSKRIPRKNIKPFFGQPMLAYPIQAALNSGLVIMIVWIPVCWAVNSPSGWLPT